MMVKRFETDCQLLIEINYKIPINNWLHLHKNKCTNREERKKEKELHEVIKVACLPTYLQFVLQLHFVLHF